MGCWAFLTTHARVLLCTRPRPQGLRLREIVATAGITGRSTHSIATDLAEADYVPQARSDRTNRHQIQAYRPLPGPRQPGTYDRGATRLLREHGPGRRPSRQFRPGPAPPVNPRHVTSPAASPCGLAAWQSGHGALRARPTRNGQRATARFRGAAAKRHAPRAWPRHPTTCMAMSNYQRWSRPPDHPGQLTTEKHERGNHP